MESARKKEEKAREQAEKKARVEAEKKAKKDREDEVLCVLARVQRCAGVMGRGSGAGNKERRAGLWEGGGIVYVLCCFGYLNPPIFLIE
jgi:membrane protein involved in colicin uptake